MQHTGVGERCALVLVFSGTGFGRTQSTYENESDLYHNGNDVDS